MTEETPEVFPVSPPGSRGQRKGLRGEVVQECARTRNGEDCPAPSKLTDETKTVSWHRGCFGGVRPILGELFVLGEDWGSLINKSPPSGKEKK